MKSLCMSCKTHWGWQWDFWTFAVNPKKCCQCCVTNLSFKKYIKITLTVHDISYFNTPCSTVLLQKLTGFQPVKKFPAFYGYRRFIIIFTSACHLSLSWASSIQSIPPHPTSWISILIFSHLHLVSQVVSFPHVSPPKPWICLSYPPYIIHNAFLSIDSNSSVSVTSQN